MLRGIRGATTVESNNSEEILRVTEALIADMAKQNDVSPEQISSVIVSMTHDLNATFPAKAIRSIDGWKYVPVMCTQEIPVPGSMEKCIRIMMNVETMKRQDEVEHIYHERARQLRPDLTN
ncbi:chorismate mutase [Salirhabdus salicampi]|uniref:chorismate mutase n=1 Tax=Salirhabdus salicampi TaxID=476102 RepID=UPI0020C2D3CF|nr:chorismate mutase [Salirhabdus salicampi]MCP8616697.1 chorismate mutase [Salirhabdus salicampi]